LQELAQDLSQELLQVSRRAPPLAQRTPALEPALEPAFCRRLHSLRHLPKPAPPPASMFAKAAFFDGTEHFRRRSMHSAWAGTRLGYSTVGQYFSAGMNAVPAELVPTWPPARALFNSIKGQSKAGGDKRRRRKKKDGLVSQPTF
jgi:hypothetical protein